MFEVYFKDSSGNKRLLSKVNTQEEVSNLIQKFIDDHNFKSYYWRTWYVPEEDLIYVDVGSWSEFFCIKKCEDS